MEAALFTSDHQGYHCNTPGENQRNVVMWMDHRAAEQAARITNTRHAVLSRMGGVMSPEMQPPKLLWLKEVRGQRGHHPATPLWRFYCGRLYWVVSMWLVFI